MSFENPDTWGRTEDEIAGLRLKAMHRRKKLKRLFLLQAQEIADSDFPDKTKND